MAETSPNSEKQRTQEPTLDRFLFSSWKKDFRGKNTCTHRYHNFNSIGAAKRRSMTRTSRTTAIAVLLMGMAATPSTSFSFPNSSLWRERYVGHHQVEQPQENQQPDYYRILGVGRQASQDDIKTAFRQLVKQYHPGTYCLCEICFEEI